MESLKAPKLKTIVLTKVMYTAIRSSGEQASDNVSEESENKSLLHRNRCGLSQVTAWFSRPNNVAAFDPSEVTEDMPAFILHRER